MSKLRDKLKVRGLKSQIEKEAASSGKKNDLRFLNFYDMKNDEKMTILFMPDVNGRLYTKFKKHGPKLNVKGVEGISCAKQTPDECPACDHAWGFHNDISKGNSKAANEKLKDTWSKWMPKDYTLAQCIVIDSSTEINQAPDGNEVKLLWLPYAIEQMIKNHIEEDILTEEEITTTPFILKKTENAGGQAEYKNSYFDRKPVSDDILDAFDEAVVEPFDFDNLDVIPAPSSEDEVQTWLDDAIEKVAKAERKQKNNKNRDEEEEDDEDEEEQEETATPDEEEDRDVTNDIGKGKKADKADKEEKPAKTGGSLRDRLSKLK